MSPCHAIPAPWMLRKLRPGKSTATTSGKSLAVQKEAQEVAPCAQGDEIEVTHYYL